MSRESRRIGLIGVRRARTPTLRVVGSHLNEPRGPLDAGAALIRLTTAVGERVLETRSESGTTALQLQVIRVAEEGATMTTIARALGSPKSTVTSVVDQLEAASLAVRVSDPDDRRRQIVRSTTAGSAQLRAFDAAIEGRIDDLLTILDPDRARRLAEMMAKLPGATVPLPLAGPR
ncbi:MAG: MarR family transcriptional regulator, lower aerobic nicotinate degradation pathway regulator [Actinomycetota bacterium]|nr:MarR family transcriptional regulator, lower aerobic nicotinate degradation pathway regulator [Actinomycetota bacterium]